MWPLQFLVLSLSPKTEFLRSLEKAGELKFTDTVTLTLWDVHTLLSQVISLMFMFKRKHKLDCK
jgi:hypothetical protein